MDSERIVAWLSEVNLATQPVSGTTCPSHQSVKARKPKGASKYPEVASSSVKAPETEPEGVSSPPTKRKKKDASASPSAKVTQKPKEKNVTSKSSNKVIPPTVVMASPVAEATVAAAAAAPAEAVSYPCGICQKEVCDDDEATLCESRYGCQRWFHRQCTGLTREAYNNLTATSNAQWVCDECVSTKQVPFTCPKDP